MKTIKKTPLQRQGRAFLLGLIVLIGGLLGVFAVQIINFDNNTIPQNFTFLENENLTANITLCNLANVTGAYLNLSSVYNTTIENYTKSWFKGVIGGGSFYPSINNANDSNWGTYVQTLTSGGTFNLMHNFTLVKDYAYIYLKWKASGCFGSSGSTIGSVCGRQQPEGIGADTNIHLFNYTLNDWQLIGETIYNYTNNSCILDSYLGGSNWNVNCSIRISDDFIKNKVIMFNFTRIGGAGYTLNFYEAGIIYENIVSNVNISIDNKQIFYYNSTFLQTNNRTNDFKTILNNSLNKGLCNCAGCVLINSNCTIPFIFHSDTAGILEVSDININWLEYILPNLTIQEPNKTYNAVTDILLKINASDNWLLSYCYFNVTRGASLEKANTRIADCNSTTFTVSGNADYVINIFVNDTSGNINISSASFSTTNYIPPIISPGGGGGIAPAPEEKPKERVCDLRFPKVKETWKIFKENKTFANFKELWYAYWDYALCKSSANIIPIE